jgi:DNA-directed RNA polymerase specialized sigma24 family protein
VAQLLNDFPSTHPSILQGVLQRQEESWTRFYHRYHSVIRSWCQRLRLSHDVCQELSQIIVVEMPCKIRTYQLVKDDGSANRFRSWLKVVVRNRVIDFLREQQQRTADYASGGFDFDARLAQELVILENDLIQANLRDAVETRRRVQARVAADTWRAYELVKVEQFAAKDAASMLAKSLCSIYTAVHRVQAALLEEYNRLLTDRIELGDEDSQDGLPQSRNTSSAA